MAFALDEDLPQVVRDTDGKHGQTSVLKRWAPCSQGRRAGKNLLDIVEVTTHLLRRLP